MHEVCTAHHLHTIQFKVYIQLYGQDAVWLQNGMVVRLPQMFDMNRKSQHSVQYTHTHTHTHTHARTHARMHTRTHAHTHTHTHTQHARTHAHTHARTHTHTITHTLWRHTPQFMGLYHSAAHTARAQTPPTGPPHLSLHSARHRRYAGAHPWMCPQL